VPKRLSAMALSRASPIEPIEPRMPVARNRLPKAQEVYCLAVVACQSQGTIPLPEAWDHLAPHNDRLA
jgi:hypothetical protein